MHSSIRMGVASYSNRTQQASKIAMAAGPLLRISRRLSSLLMASMPVRRSQTLLIAVEIVRKNPDQIGFAVQPRRWGVERFFAWIGPNRRLTTDFEATTDSARAFLYAASVMLLVRRIARPS